MNFEHVCANMLVAIVICVVCLGCVAIVGHCDNFVMSQGRRMLCIKVCVIGSSMACILKTEVWQSVGMGIVFGALLFACITDHAQCQVYHFTWWIIGSILLVWLFVAMSRNAQVPWGELFVFCILQEFFFSRLYGKADCHAFCACAMLCAIHGKGMMYYLLHMATSLGVLAGVQWRRGNITRSGNLKISVPFIPYIVLAFLLLYVAITCEVGREML